MTIETQQKKMNMKIVESRNENKWSKEETRI